MNDHHVVTAAAAPTASPAPAATGADPGHVPVMLQRCVDLLAPALQAPGALVMDSTLGLGGHAAALLAACPHAHLVGVDRDPAALEIAAQRLAPFDDRTTFVHARYDEVPRALAAAGRRRVDAVLMDLGVSSLQLDQGVRGFSYSRDAPLDMRMGGPTSDAPTAADLLNTAEPRELVRVLRAYGEERFATRIVDSVVREREREPFTTSARLVDLVRAAVPAATRRTGGNPAKRTFQALRIAVNGELDSLEAALPAVLDALAVGGRVVVMSYQSLEDRLVKTALAAGAASTSPPSLPVELPGHEPRLELLTRGAESAGPGEVAANPRAASVRLRAARRVREAV